jgi:diguanylate cyclase (GGDEF)-like protein
MMATQETDDAQTIRRMTCFDTLTGLPNRLLFREQLSLVLRLARRNGSSGAVLLADIDDFRRIKNSLGHARGDAFIRTMAQRVAACLRDSDVLAGGSAIDGAPSIARVSGTEFAIILSGLAAPHDALIAAQRIREAVARPVTLGGTEVFATLSVGVALFPGEGIEADALIECADLALGQAKENGKDRIQFYSASIEKIAANQMSLHSSLRRALEQKQFFAVFQPRIDARTGQPCGAEALVRWRHPQRGVLAPSAFLDACEQSRLIVPLGTFMLEAACRQNRLWQDQGLPPFPISVNVSTAQVGEPGFVGTVARVLESTGMAARWLELEITESVLMNDAAGALQTFSAIKAMGVRVALDDFGTGFSSLAYLRDFPVDVLKIDRSFVSGLPADSRSASITCLIVDLARRLELEVVAEGVETDAQSEFLNANGCHLMQGFKFCRPVEPEALAEYWGAIDM